MLYLFDEYYPDYDERMQAIAESMWFWMCDDDELLTLVAKG